MNLINKAINYLLPTREQYPPDVRKWIEKNKDVRILSAYVARSPVNTIVKKVMNIVSRGSFEKNIKDNYDDLFHLFLVVILEDGSRWRIEKNEVVRVSPQKEPIVDMMQVNIDHPITGGELLMIPYEMFKTDMTKYDAIYFNCQRFITDILRANRLLTPELSAYINQDALKIIKSDSFEHKFSRIATDLAAKIDRALYGNGFSLSNPRRKRTTKIKRTKRKRNK